MTADSLEFNILCGHRPPLQLSQFSEGFSMLSITRVSTGPFEDSSLRPSCSCSAVNIDGPAGSGGGGAGTPGTGPNGPVSPGSGVQCSWMSKNPLRPVLFTIVRPTVDDSC